MGLKPMVPFGGALMSSLMPFLFAILRRPR